MYVVVRGLGLQLDRCVQLAIECTADLMVSGSSFMFYGWNSLPSAMRRARQRLLSLDGFQRQLKMIYLEDEFGADVAFVRDFSAEFLTEPGTEDISFGSTRLN